MDTGIDSGSGPWYSRSRASHNQQHSASLSCLSAYVTITSHSRASITCCHVTPLHFVLFSFPLCSYFIQVYVWFFAYPLSQIFVITISSTQTCRLLYFPKSSVSLACPLFRPLPVSHIPFFIVSLLLFCYAQMVYVQFVLTSGYLRFDWNRQSSLKVGYCVASAHFGNKEKIETSSTFS